MSLIFTANECRGSTIPLDSMQSCPGADWNQFFVPLLPREAAAVALAGRRKNPKASCWVCREAVVSLLDTPPRAVGTSSRDHSDVGSPTAHYILKHARCARQLKLDFRRVHIFLCSPAPQLRVLNEPSLLIEGSGFEGTTSRGYHPFHSLAPLPKNHSYRHPIQLVPR